MTSLAPRATRRRESRAAVGSPPSAASRRSESPVDSSSSSLAASRTRIRHGEEATRIVAHTRLNGDGGGTRLSARLDAIADQQATAHEGPSSAEEEEEEEKSHSGRRRRATTSQSRTSKGKATPANKNTPSIRSFFAPSSPATSPPVVLATAVKMTAPRDSLASKTRISISPPSPGPMPPPVPSPPVLVTITSSHRLRSVSRTGVSADDGSDSHPSLTPDSLPSSTDTSAGATTHTDDAHTPTRASTRGTRKRRSDLIGDEEKAASSAASSASIASSLEPAVASEIICDACSRARGRCNRMVAGCTRCLQRGISCTYTRTVSSISATSEIDAAAVRSPTHSALGGSHITSPVSTPTRSKRPRHSPPGTAESDVTSILPDIVPAAPLPPTSSTAGVAATSVSTSLSVNATSWGSHLRGIVPSWTCANPTCANLCASQTQRRMGMCARCRTPRGSDSPVVATTPTASIDAAAVAIQTSATTVATSPRRSPRGAAKRLDLGPAPAATPLADASPSISLASTRPSLTDDEAPMKTDSIVAETASTTTSVAAVSRDGSYRTRAPSHGLVRATSSLAPEVTTPRVETSGHQEVGAHTSAHSSSVIADDDARTILSTPTTSAAHLLQRCASDAASDLELDIEMTPVDDAATGPEAIEPTEVISFAHAGGSGSTAADAATAAAISFALDRTFSSAATPVQLTQEDDGEMSVTHESMESPKILALPDLDTALPIPMTKVAATVESHRGESSRQPDRASPPQWVRRADATAHVTDADAHCALVKPSVKRKKLALITAPVAPPRSAYTMADMSTASASLAPTGASFEVRAAAASCCGFHRKINQDTFVCTVLPPLGGSAPLFVTAVFDGHGILGHLAADTCRRDLTHLLTRHMLEGADVSGAIERTAAELHARLNDDADKIRGAALASLAPPPPPPPAHHAHAMHHPDHTDTNDHRLPSHASPPKPRPLTGGLFGADYGTTAVIAVVQESTLWIAHVGDSRCMVIQREARRPPPKSGTHAARRSHDEWQIVHLSEDHNCDLSSERARVQSEGGSLHFTGSEYRVFPNSMDFQEARGQQLTLNMSRSLGHIKLGVHGISALPEVKCLQLAHGTESLIVLGSDGLYDVLDPVAIRSIVTREDAPLDELVHSLLSSSDVAWQAKKHGDNVTAVVMRVAADR